MSYLVIGLAGPELTDEERRWLARDEVGGAILFSRNFHSVDQVRRLCDAIREVDRDAVILIDQEGGRVQRIGEPLTVLPPLGAIGAVYDDDEDLAMDVAFVHGKLMAMEVLAIGADLSLAPVLDLRRKGSIIADRAFHADPLVVKALGRTYIKGMHDAGMAACAKHFPGHGSVEQDTHLEHAVDPRPFDELAITDLRPFTVAIQEGLDAVMMAHVVYPEIDERPAGYSRVWIQDILRKRIGFEGVVISDDLGMAAACDVGGFEDRLTCALEAGCDLVLVCRPDDVARVFGEVRQWPQPGEDRRALIRAGEHPDWGSVSIDDAHQELRERLAALV
ncbi:MAG: beta-N-acetylhexosaminidase [Xanthomonadales bacterium]|nr:beta-N-acetylhexosaminidase [Xanthomonadales bacterium]